MIVARTTPSPFPPDEVSILEDGRASDHGGRSLAFEEIQKLRSQLQDERAARRDRGDGRSSGRDHRRFTGAARVLERVGLIAATDSTVLITGETGTGRSSSPRDPLG